MKEHMIIGRYNESGHAAEAKDVGVVPAVPGERAVSPAIKVGRILLLVALLPIVGLYLAPRAYHLTVMPAHLDEAVASAHNYNPALDRIAEQEEITITAFTALERMQKGLADVHVVDERVAAELATLSGQISGDIHTILDAADANVTDLVDSLNGLTVHVDSLNAPVDGAAAALTDNRATLSAVLDDARSTADEVRNARLSAESSANDLSGR
jgi:hypothetical protein